MGGVVSQWYARSGGSAVVWYAWERTWDRERREARKDSRLRSCAWSNAIQLGHVDVAINGTEQEFV